MTVFLAGTKSDSGGLTIILFKFIPIFRRRQIHSLCALLRLQSSVHLKLMSFRTALATVSKGVPSWTRRLRRNIMSKDIKMIRNSARLLEMLITDGNQQTVPNVDDEVGPRLKIGHMYIYSNNQDFPPSIFNETPQNLHFKVENAGRCQ